MRIFALLLAATAFFSSGSVVQANPKASDSLSIDTHWVLAIHGARRSNLQEAFPSVRLLTRGAWPAGTLQYAIPKKIYPEVRKWARENHREALLPQNVVKATFKVLGKPVRIDVPLHAFAADGHLHGNPSAHTLVSTYGSQEHIKLLTTTSPRKVRFTETFTGGKKMTMRARLGRALQSRFLGKARTKKRKRPRATQLRRARAR